jgi:lipoate-protein ligase B
MRCRACAGVLRVQALQRCSFRVQIWVGERKVGAVGVRIARGVTTHGLALDVNTDLSWYDKIVPCGHRVKKVSTIEQLLGEEVPMDMVQRQLVEQLLRQYGHARVSEISIQDLREQLQA